MTRRYKGAAVRIPNIRNNGSGIIYGTIAIRWNKLRRKKLVSLLKQSGTALTDEQDI